MSKDVTPDRLDGWGEICAYLGASDRKTVLRRDYPIHYHRTGRVHALRSELDAHTAECPQTPAYTRKRPQTPVSF